MSRIAHRTGLDRPDGLRVGRAVAECADSWFLCLITAGRGHLSGLLADLGDACFFNPIVTRRVISKNGEGREYRRPVRQQLFPGYIFLNGQPARDAAFDSFHAYRVDTVADGMQGQLTNELAVVEYEIGKNPEVVAGPIFTAGHVVKIIHPHELAGTTGRVAAERDGTVWVNIPLLNAGIPLEVAAEFLEVVRETAAVKRTLKISCGGCGRDTYNATGLCDVCGNWPE